VHTVFNKDLSSELAWYDLKKALTHHLQPKYLSEIDKDLIKSLCYKDIKQTIWKIAIWEENNIKYDYEKSEIKENATYITDSYGKIISIKKNPKPKTNTKKRKRHLFRFCNFNICPIVKMSSPTNLYIQHKQPYLCIR